MNSFINIFLVLFLSIGLFVFLLYSEYKMSKLKSIRTMYHNEKYGYKVIVSYISGTQVYEFYSDYHYCCLQELLIELPKCDFGYIYRKDGKREMFKIENVDRVGFEVVNMEEEK